MASKPLNAASKTESKFEKAQRIIAGRLTKTSLTQMIKRASAASWPGTTKH